jgi:hypothetical protein
MGGRYLVDFFFCHFYVRCDHPYVKELSTTSTLSPLYLHWSALL